jgi:hypothetical protein
MTIFRLSRRIVKSYNLRMEIARLRHVNAQCPAGTMPFFDSFGTSFQCVRVGRGFSGLAGLSGMLWPDGSGFARKAVTLAALAAVGYYGYRHFR